MFSFAFTQDRTSVVLQSEAVVSQVANNRSAQELLTHLNMQHVRRQHRRRIQHLPHRIQQLATQLGNLHLPTRPTEVLIGRYGGRLVEVDLVVCGDGCERVVAGSGGSGVASGPLGLEAVAPERVHSESTVEGVEGEVAVLPEERCCDAVRVGGCRVDTSKGGASDTVRVVMINVRKSGWVGLTII